MAQLLMSHTNVWQPKMSHSKQLESDENQYTKIDVVQGLIYSTIDYTKKYVLPRNRKYFKKPYK